MARRESGGGARSVGGLRGRSAVAASILGVLLVGGYFATDTSVVGGNAAEYLIHAAILVVAFWFPAQRLGSPRELLQQWRPLLAWLLAWTLVWDLATAGVVGEREVFSEWWLVYPSGVLLLGALLLLHAAVVQRVGADAPAA